MQGGRSQNGGRDCSLIRALRSQLSRNILKGAPRGLVVSTGTAARLGETGAPGLSRKRPSVRGRSGAVTRESAPVAVPRGRSCDCGPDRALAWRGRLPPPGPLVAGGAEEPRPGADRTADLAGRPGAREDSVSQRGRGAILNLTAAVAACTSCSGTKKGHSSPAKKTLSSGGPAGCGGFRCRV
ncbi:hypothetical protein NDU88_008174 [Pleurodeles waltl]|uniref:Uncharacterized protein n=1 Tax=Pleurodeles waltl TaxID=8319 RepID=A0AAV7RRJ8_PLEWA|nr:hypothetical protein NDU88_008174 [Pleurodeles waltl]